MPLNPVGPDLSFLDSPASDYVIAAEDWGNAIGDYALSITQVIVADQPAVEGAKATLIASLSSTFPIAVDPATAFDAPMATFASTVALSMSTFVGVPPLAPFSSFVFTPPDQKFSDSQIAINTLGPSIYSWFITGTAAPIAGGPPVPWL